MEIALNILFLPLLGGYLFYCTFHGSQFVAGRRPKSVAIFWWAGVGLILLAIARVATMAAQWSLTNKVAVAPHLLLTVLPPVLALMVTGILLHAITTWLTGTQFLSGRSLWKAVLGIALAAAATWITWSRLPAAHALALEVVGSAAALYFPWAIAFIAASVAAYLWARKFRMPVGAVVFRMSLVLIVIVELIAIAFAYLPEIKAFWIDFTLPLGNEANDDAIGLAALACLLGPLGSTALNFLLPRDIAASRHFESDWVNGFEELTYTAAQKGRMLMLTMTNRKVYIGHVEWVAPHPEADDAYIQVVPQFSGYRTQRTSELKITTSYDGVYQGLSAAQVRGFRKVIPISRIITAAEFNISQVAPQGNTLVPASPLASPSGIKSQLSPVGAPPATDPATTPKTSPKS